MNKLKFNPDNAKYYSEDFIKGFECGVERQFNADMAEKTAEWIIGSYEVKCSHCEYLVWGSGLNAYKEWKFCPNCGAKMKGVNQ